jgi:hypothetical protein
VCPSLLCLEILRGLRDQLQADGRDLEKNVLAAIREEEKQESELLSYHGEFYDDVSGEDLPKALVIAGRELEMAFFRKEGVYTKRPVAECWQRTGQAPIRVKWIDRNKGDKSNPDIRCRLVACQYNMYKDADLFAAAPGSPEVLHLRRRYCEEAWRSEARKEEWSAQAAFH